MNGPISEGIYLPLVHPDATAADVFSKELHCGLMERALLGLEVELKGPQTLQDLRNVALMFCQAPVVYEDIIYVDEDELVEELPEHLVDKVLEDGGGVNKSIRYHAVFIVASRGYEGSFPLVPLSYPDEVIGAAELQLGEYSGTTEMFQGSWDEWKWVPEFARDVVESPIVDTWS